MADDRPTTINDPEPLTRPIADELSNAVAEDLESFDSAQAERDSERVFTADGEELPSSGLLSFYDRLRDRVLHAAEKRGGKLVLLVEDGSQVIMSLKATGIDQLIPMFTNDRDAEKAAAA